MAHQVQWDDSMSVGVEVLDQDHRHLIALLNAYLEAVENDEGLMVTDSILNGLVDYTMYHFAREERIMEACGYPRLDEHKIVHKKMAQQVLDQRDSFLLFGGSDASVQTLVDFLMNWLKDHILKVDMDYRQYTAADPDAVAGAAKDDPTTEDGT